MTPLAYFLMFAYALYCVVSFGVAGYIIWKVLRRG